MRRVYRLILGVMLFTTAWSVADLLPPASPAQAAPSDCDASLPGAGSVYFGGWIPAALDNPKTPRSQDPLGRFEEIAGKRVSILQRWEHWGLGPGGRVDIKWLRRVTEAGALPMITWVPWNPTIKKPEFQRGFLLKDIAAGRFDSYISDIASEVAEWNGPIFIRWAQEMNGTWYPWGKHQNDPADYIAAWRHIHEIFQRKGATQVTWVWNPSEKNHPESLGLWYPGDDYVDWVAVDGYNWDDANYWKDESGNTWRTPEQVWAPSFDDITTFVGREKPWMIAETATPERRGEPGKKASWICDAFRRTIPERFPRVKAVMWFQQPTDEGGKPFGWQADTSGASREAFARAVEPGFYVTDIADAIRRLGRARIPEPSVLLALPAS
ncbi:MAG: glycosyl hydrolase [Chloroflexota bacterium]